MREDEVIAAIINYLADKFKTIRTEVPIGYGKRGNPLRADILAGTLAIEAKATHGDLRQAIGQAAFYRAHGYDAAIAIGAPLQRHQIDAVVDSNIGLLVVHGNDVEAIYERFITL